MPTVGTVYCVSLTLKKNQNHEDLFRLLEDTFYGIRRTNTTWFIVSDIPVEDTNDTIKCYLGKSETAVLVKAGNKWCETGASKELKEWLTRNLKQNNQHAVESFVDCLNV